MKKFEYEQDDIISWLVTGDDTWGYFYVNMSHVVQSYGSEKILLYLKNQNLKCLPLLKMCKNNMKKLKY